jgi:hypothetical protein
VQFQRGHGADALDTIDEAIAIAPEVPYFREQRRRFSGDRAAHDRPDPPDGYVEPAPAPEEFPFGPDPHADEDPGIAI